MCPRWSIWSSVTVLRWVSARSVAVRSLMRRSWRTSRATGNSVLLPDALGLLLDRQHPVEVERRRAGNAQDHHAALVRGRDEPLLATARERSAPLLPAARRVERRAIRLQAPDVEVGDGLAEHAHGGGAVATVLVLRSGRH